MPTKEVTGYLAAIDGHALALRRLCSHERGSNLFVRRADGFPSGAGRCPKDERNDDNERPLGPVPSTGQLRRFHNSHRRDIVRGREVELIQAGG